MNRNNTEQKDIKDRNRRDLGIYIHIPFCEKKCDYCDFLSAPAGQETKERYKQALINEINSYQGRTGNYQVSTIFIGGGTPSCLKAFEIEEILDAVKVVFFSNNLDSNSYDIRNREVSIEVNPGTVNLEKLKAYRAAGINRISFGLQSADNRELSLLGRIHSYEQFTENFLAAREAGFQNINIDLMSALPGQTLKSWETTLYRVLTLQPEHISAYSLIIEEGTPFYLRYKKEQPEFQLLPDEETDRTIYHRTKEILNENGYHRYEISNYSKEGYECRHNISYWTGIDYLGIGLGASSLLYGARFRNLHDLNLYIQLCSGVNTEKTYVNTPSVSPYDEVLQDCFGLRREIEILSLEDQMEEFMILGLRMCQGVNKTLFFNRFAKKLEKVFGHQLKRLSDQKLIEISRDNIRLTDYGIDVSNMVLSTFLSD